MQTYMNQHKNVGRSAQPGKGHDLSRSEMLHLSGAGAPQPMSPALREKFEPGFSADFSNIRISRGHIPEELGVQAVAQGTDILLDQSAGMDVLGHELAHVVQQAQGRVEGGFPVVENAALEHEADVMGARAASGLSAQVGGENGFSGGIMSITPMSAASAPAQCKIGKHKPKKKAQAAPAQQAATPVQQAPAPAQPQVSEIGLEQYFPAIGARDELMAEVDASRTQQRQSAAEYAASHGLMELSDDSGQEVNINHLAHGRAFGSLYRQGDDMYNYFLRSLWTPKGGLNTDLSEREMVSSYQFLAAPIYDQIRDTDFSSMTTGEQSVRANFAGNNVQVGRLNSLGDIRKAIASHLAGKATRDPSEKAALAKAKDAELLGSTLAASGLSEGDLALPGAIGLKMQKAMGLKGRLDTYGGPGSEPDSGINPAYDALRASNPNARLLFPRQELEDYLTPEERRRRR